MTKMDTLRNLGREKYVELTIKKCFYNSRKTDMVIINLQNMMWECHMHGT